MVATRTIMKACGLLVIFLWYATLSTAKAQTPPYPPSPVIAGISFLWSTHQSAAPGSDNWPVTWAEDGCQYTAWGDGGGFGGTNKLGRVSLGTARIEGPWHRHRGVNLWGGNMPERPATFPGKSYGIICVDGNLYMWVGLSRPKTTPFDEVRLAMSTDKGKSWDLADWTFTKADAVMLPTICQFGQNNSRARDEYVYHYLIRYRQESGPDDYEDKVDWLQAQRPGTVDLARVPNHRMMERSAYEFYTSLDDIGQPRWIAALSQRQPVFEDPNGVGWNLSVSYNPGLQRYFLCTEHTETHRGKLGIFDAEEPWGPWNTIAYYDNWGEGHVSLNTFFWNFAPAWYSVNGKQFSMVFTGRKENDSWNMIRGFFKLY